MKEEHIKNPGILVNREIKLLTIEQKLKVYLHYYITMIGLKHDFIFRDLTTKKIITKNPSENDIIEDITNKGYGKPDKVVNKIGIYYLWKYFLPINFDEFINGSVSYYKNEYDHRNNTGIYNWYWKFKDEIFPE